MTTITKAPADPQALAAQVELYRVRWQRVLAAYLALRELRCMQRGSPQTPVIARALTTAEELHPEDLKLDR